MCVCVSGRMSLSQGASVVPTHANALHSAHCVSRPRPSCTHPMRTATTMRRPLRAVDAWTALMTRSGCSVALAVWRRQTRTNAGDLRHAHQREMRPGADSRTIVHTASPHGRRHSAPHRRLAGANPVRCVPASAVTAAEVARQDSVPADTGQDSLPAPRPHTHKQMGSACARGYIPAQLTRVGWAAAPERARRAGEGQTGVSWAHQDHTAHMRPSAQAPQLRALLRPP